MALWANLLPQSPADLTSSEGLGIASTSFLSPCTPSSTHLLLDTWRSSWHMRVQGFHALPMVDFYGIFVIPLLSPT